jgi:hypothetical protein
MKVKFQTKEESNLKQEEYFLNLSPGERFSHWLIMMEYNYRLFGPPKNPEKNKNFLIIIPQKKSN